MTVIFVTKKKLQSVMTIVTVWSLIKMAILINVIYYWIDLKLKIFIFQFPHLHFIRSRQSSYTLLLSFSSLSMHLSCLKYYLNYKILLIIIIK